MTTQTEPGTAERLIAAGLDLFGHRGFEGTSTRALADHAGTNVASIAYHFGSKDGLHTACADAVGKQVGAALDAAVNAPLPPDAESAMIELERSVRAFTAMLMTGPQGETVVSFILRELTNRGPVAEHLFETVFEPRHRRFSALWGIITGEPAESEEVKLAVFAALGQVIYFRIAQPYIARRLGWDHVGPSEAQRVADLIIANIRASAERSQP